MINNFTVSPSTGDVYSTEFKVTSLPFGNFIKYAWDFGNKQIIYNEKQPTFIYKKPGIQTITLTATDVTGDRYTFTQTVSTDFPYRDYVKFISVPDDFADPGLMPTTPFKIEVLCSQIDQPLNIDLFAANTNSIPSQFVYKRWEFLNPTWKFLDTNFKKIDTLPIISTPIYKNGTVVAVSGTGEFYFVDSSTKGDLSINKPLLITATLQTSGFVNTDDFNYFDYPSYSNSETVKAGILWYVNDLSPRLLKVTSNYLDNLPKEIWAGIKTPFLITCHGNKSLQIKDAPDRTSEVLFTYPATNEIGNIQPVDITLLKKTKNDFAIGDNNQYTDLYFQARDNKNFRLGGFIFNTITPNTNAITDNSTLIVKATAYNVFSSDRENKFIYPIGSSPNTAAWISNPTHNTLNKITALPYRDDCPTINYFKEKKALVDGYIKQITVPSITGIQSFNYSNIEGSEVYSVTVDPRDNSAIAADASQSKLFRFSPSGEILNVFDFLDIDRKNEITTTTWTASSLTPARNTLNYTNPTGAPLFEITDIFIIPDGTIAFILDKTTREVYKYTLLIPNDISSKQYTGERFSFVNVDTQPTKILFKPDGTKMYMLGNQTSNIYEFLLSEPWRITTGVSLVGSRGFNVPSQFNTTCFALNEEGTILLIGGVGVNNIAVFGGIRVYNLLVPWTITSATSNPFIFSVPSLTLISNILLTPNNYDQKLIVLDKRTNRIAEFNFVRPFNYNTIFLTSSFYNLPKPIQDISLNSNNFSLFLLQNNEIDEYTFDIIQHTALNTPSHISLDRDCNIWVSLFNSVSVVKLDKDFNYLFSVAPTGIDIETVYDGDYLLKPPVVETDKNSNCWATYAHPLCCLLVKYSPEGQILAQTPLEKYSVPNGLAVTPQNNVWVMNSYNVLEDQGSFELYNEAGTQRLLTVPVRFRPSYFSLDRDANIWFTYGVRRFGTIDTETFSTTTWQLSYDDIDDPFFPPTFITEDEKRTDELFGGLATDAFNRVWLIDTYNSNVWILSASPNFKEQSFKRIKIMPSQPKGYFIDTSDYGLSYTDSVNQFTVQAAGDWTGNKWYQKYCDQAALSSVELSGVSTPFNITPFTNNYQIRKQNESFNMASHLQSLILEENFANNNFFFKDFLGTVVGDSSDNTYQDIGQTVYERTANFTTQHADIDTCGIDQLLSYAEMTNTPYLDYGMPLPVEAKNFLDTASIPRNKLCGMPDAIPLLIQSLGSELDYFTATVSAGEKIVLRSLLTGKYTVVILPVINNTYVYQLSAFNSSIFDQPISKRYQFYTFVPKYTDTYIENLVDWNSANTVLSPTMSTYEDWYGDEGIIENNFKYILTKNLFTK